MRGCGCSVAATVRRTACCAPVATPGPAAVGLGQLHEQAAAGVPQRHHPGLRDLLDEVAEGAGAVVAFGERGVELQERALEEPQLRGDLAVDQHLERALD